MANPFLLFIQPTPTLRRLRASPDWLIAFLSLSALSIAIYILIHPYLVQAILSHLPPSATPEEKLVVAQTLNSELALRCLFLPIRLLIGWTSFAIILFLVCKSFVPPEPVFINKVFSLEVHAEVFNVCAQAATLLYLFIDGKSGNEPSLVPFSAAMFIASDNIVMFSLLNSLNIFTLIYFAILTIGISLQSEFSRSKSFVIVLIAWLALLLFNVGTIKLLQDTLHLIP